MDIHMDIQSVRLPDAAQEDYCNKVYHIGDCSYFGDIVLIFGLVRWLPEA